MTRQLRKVTSIDGLEYLSPPQVGILLQISTRTVLRYLHAKTIPGKRIGTKWRSKRSEIDKYLSAA